MVTKNLLQVLDPRTRLILFRLLQRNIFTSIDGCVSTGKEANVYHGFRSDGTSVAIKIYKTSILTFKDRDRYVSGEFRYRLVSGACRVFVKRFNFSEKNQTLFIFCLLYRVWFFFLASMFLSLAC